jgi:hypothetical protein
MVDELHPTSKILSFLYYLTKNPIFSLSAIFILITFPFILVSVFLYIFSTKFKLTFRITGFYKISDLHFLFENHIIKIDVQVKEIRFKLIWFRLRFSVSGVRSYTEFKEGKLLEKKHSRESSKFNENLNQDPQGEQGENKNLIIIDEQNENENNTETLQHEQHEDLPAHAEENFANLKEKFHNILREKFTRLEKNVLGQTVRILKDTTGKPLNTVDNILSGKKSNKLDRLIRCLIVLLDVEINNTSSVVKFESENFYHEVCLGKVLIGAVRGVEKVR